MRPSGWRSSLRRIQCQQLPYSPRSSGDSSGHHEPWHICSRCRRTGHIIFSAQRRLHSSASSSTSATASTDTLQPNAERVFHRGAVKAKRPPPPGVPQPPALPDWFLEHNVRRHVPIKTWEEQLHGEGSWYALQVLDPYNDRELAEVPIYKIGPPREDHVAWLHQLEQFVTKHGGKWTGLPTSARGSRDFFKRVTVSGVIEDTKEQGSAEVQASPASILQPDAATMEPATPDRASEKQYPDSVLAAAVDLALRSANFDQDKLFAVYWARMQAQMVVHSTLRLSSSPTRARHLRDLVVLSPPQRSHAELDVFVEDVADLAHADIIRIDASDIAELAGSYIDSEGQGTGTGTISSLAYDAFEGVQALTASTTALSSSNATSSNDGHQPIARQDTGNEAMVDVPRNIEDALKMAAQRALGALGQDAANFRVRAVRDMGQPSGESMIEEKDTEVEEALEVPDLDKIQRLKFKRLFKNMITTVLQQARDTGTPNAETKIGDTVGDMVGDTVGDKVGDTVGGTVDDKVAYPPLKGDNFLRQKFSDIRSVVRHPAHRRELLKLDQDGLSEFSKKYGRKRPGTDHLRQHMLSHIFRAFGNDKPTTTKHKVLRQAYKSSLSGRTTGTIVHVRDIHMIYESPHGEEIIELLQEAIAGQRADGKPIMMLGTLTEYQMGDAEFVEGNAENYERTGGYMAIQYNLTAPQAGSNVRSDEGASGTPPVFMGATDYPVYPDDPRLLQINLRNIQQCITQLGIEYSPALFGEATRPFLFAPGLAQLGKQVLRPAVIQQLVLLAEGFRELYTLSTQLDMVHLAVAVSFWNELMERNKQIPVDASVKATEPSSQPQAGDVVRSDGTRQKEAPRREVKKLNLEEMKRFASRHEQRLFPGIVDPANIKTTYDDIHVARGTVDALKTVTTLALLRPQAFSYGVLARDRLPGLLLYGPPGTGKTLLAKAVAKDASATVLEISGAQIYEKYVGEGEKMVRAVFSLAKRLSPCVVFIDEADALFSSRSGNSNRTTHREIINQFLREWDGMNDHQVFMMVATNRPFDLDDAVLRRLPRRILVDLPTQEDRTAILKIHLSGEEIAPDVSLEKLAEQTPYYSGSDLKNVCVAAALEAVKEENELLAAHKDDPTDFTLPDRRVLTLAHFHKAIQEISASISEDMTSLKAIKKFDEQYGDRRGRKKKTSYGFESMEMKDDESAARVR